mgnify:CR=1 FL=1|jgi:hypothetical protein
MTAKKTLLALFALGTATTLYANNCEQYLKSFEKQHKMIGTIAANSTGDDSAVRANYVENKINNILMGMNMNLKLMINQGCKNIPDYGIEVLDYKSSGTECWLARNTNSKKYSEESCYSPERSGISQY